jgi:hypothetical protein
MVRIDFDEMSRAFLARVGGHPLWAPQNLDIYQSGLRREIFGPRTPRQQALWLSGPPQ